MPPTPSPSNTNPQPTNPGPPRPTTPRSHSSHPIFGPDSYDIDLLEEAAVVEWYAQAPDQKDGARKTVREAAAPFIKWLQEAEEDPKANSSSK